MRLIVSVLLAVFVTAEHTAAPRKVAVAHRGASAYAPEHTLASYRLALEQGADYVEQDLAVTKDGVLVCLHDPTLDRTTNVEELFPGRSSTVTWEGKTVTAWLANDFTLEEMKRLDAGSWFDQKFAGERIPTFQEAIDLVKGRAGIYPELKVPEVYAGRNVEFEQKVADILATNGLLGRNADPKTPVILQTFSEATVRKLASMKLAVPVVYLIYGYDANEWSRRDRVVAAKAAGASGLGPAKDIVLKYPQVVTWAHELGLTVTPYTFRSSNTGRFPSVREEMAYFLYELGVDGVFTDNPDQFPRR
ncbi:MAG: glycerophosphodiester phosphodiesterase family protein [Vicinamibacterales bacterium]